MSKPPADILLITTGGTIDGEAYPDPDHPPDNVTPLPQSVVPEALEAVRRKLHAAGEVGDVRIRHVPWTMKDSKEFVVDSEGKYSLQRLIDLGAFIAAQPEKHVIITHGTDFMAPNARIIQGELEGDDKERWQAVLGRNGKAMSKTVAFTGAMVPLANGERSDGPANLEYTLRNITGWKPGVYVSMGSKCFGAQYVEKDPVAKEFYLPL